MKACLVIVMASLSIRRRKTLISSQFSEQVPLFLQMLLMNRGINKDSEIKHELSELIDPFLMQGMQTAVERLWQALLLNQRIIIVGDYDADGATSTALLMRGLHTLGFSQLSFEVPNRFEYGYGLSERIVEELSWQKPQLIITVDNGISSIVGVNKANALGIDVIVTDHHLPGTQLPEAIAIINPNQPLCTFPYKSLAGVGVAFHLLIALRSYWREKKWFINEHKAEPNLAQWLDIVALGTVADVVPMDFYNRILVAQGLKRIRAQQCCAGIQQLLLVAQKSPTTLSAVDLGFVLGPRLNAAGRLDDMSQGIMLLLTDSDSLAGELAQTLDDLNKDRRDIELQMQIEAQRIVDNILPAEQALPRGFCLYHQEWHQGVVGLIASRVKEKYHRPVIAFAPAENGELKGSGRSIRGVHLRDVLDEIASHYPGIIDKFGGHAMAAGLSIQNTQLVNFEQAFSETLAKIHDKSIFEPVIETDGALVAADMTLLHAQSLRDSMPWGQQFPEPLFDGEFFVQQRTVLSGKHIKYQLTLERDSNQQWEAIYFNVPNEVLNACVDKIFIVYKMAINDFRGKQALQLIVQYQQT